jgi:hypothetical protein
MAGAILLITCNTAVDMQQDRSTGWRLGTNRVIQFRYQVAGDPHGRDHGVVFASSSWRRIPCSSSTRRS